MIFDVHPRYELALSTKKELLVSFSITWTWGINCSWIGSAQSRNRRLFVATKKTFFQGAESPSSVPISLNRFQLPSVISDYLCRPMEECFLAGELSLFAPKLDNIHDPILLGKLKTTNGTLATKGGPSEVNFKVYTTEGVSFPLWDSLTPAGFCHTIFFDPHYQKPES